MIDSNAPRSRPSRAISWIRDNKLSFSLVVIGVTALVAAVTVVAVFVPGRAKSANLATNGATRAPTDGSDTSTADASASPGQSPSQSSSPSAKPGSTPTGRTNPTTGRPPSATGFPDATNTGVPAGTQLTNYTGPCTITTNNTVIDAKTVNCDLNIRAQGVVIKRSKVNGEIDTAEKTSFSYTLEDSEVDAGLRQAKAVGTTNVTIRRANIHGGATSVYCFASCDVRDSWLHGQRLPDGSDWHLGGFLANDGSNAAGGRTNAVLVHNTIACDSAPTGSEGGCSGDVNMFGDFGTVNYVTVDNNLLGSNTGISFCVYGGSSSSKPYQPDHIVVMNNVFQRGSNRKCGGYGPVSGFDPSRPGNQWSNNVWDDGVAVQSEL